MSKRNMQFLYGDRELLIRVGDLLSAPVDVIVNPANTGLSHGDGLAGQILEHAGEELQQESVQLIKEHGELESGMSVYTTAGRLPYKAVIHAVGPKQGEGHEQFKIEQAVSRSLKLCEINEWHSIAFPAISTGIYNVPVDVCAQGFFRAITSFWDARIETSPMRVLIYLSEPHFEAFFHAFRNEAIDTDESAENSVVDDSPTDNPEAGIVDIDELQIDSDDDDEINDWFK